MNICLIRTLEFFESKEPIHPRDTIPSFALLNIASFLEKNKIHYQHLDNEVLHLDSRSFKKKSLKKFFDVYIINFQPLVNEEIIKLIKDIKKKNENSVVIAFSPIIDQETKLFLEKSGADLAVLGEVEQSVFQLINLVKKTKKNYSNYLVKAKIPGTAFFYKGKFIKQQARKPLKPDDLPFMAHHLLYEKNQTKKIRYQVTSKTVFVKEKIKWGFLLSSRGCPFNCTFCSPSIRNSIGKKYRFQSAKRTADEIEFLVNNFAVNAISFEDDLFTLNKKRVIELCKEIIKREIKISWTVATRLDSLDMELAHWMKKAGCFGMSVGVETGSDRILSLINKGENLKDIKRGMLILKKVGIAVTVNLIIGHPTETLEELNQTLNLVKELQPIFIHLHYLTPYPGTKIFEQYKKELKNFKEFSHWRTQEFNISNIKTETLQKMMKKIYFKYYLNFTYLKNYFKYRYQYLIYNPKFELKFLYGTIKYLVLKT